MTSRSLRGGLRPARSWGRAVMYLVLLAVAIPLFFLPLWIVIVTSFKPLGEAIELSPGLPQTWSALENYAEVFAAAKAQAVEGAGGDLAAAFGAAVVAIALVEPAVDRDRGLGRGQCADAGQRACKSEGVNGFHGEVLQG